MTTTAMGITSYDPADLIKDVKYILKQQNKGLSREKRYKLEYWRVCLGDCHPHLAVYMKDPNGFTLQVTEAL